MKKRTRLKKYGPYIVISLISLLLRIADMVITYMYTPDLALEANPLVTQFGAGWSSLIISNIIAQIIIMVLAYFPFVYYKRTFVKCNNIKEYISILHFERPDRFNRILIDNTKNKLFIMVPIGFSFVLAYIVADICVVFSNALALMKAPYPCLFCFMKIPHTICNMIQIHTSNGHLQIPVVLITVFLLTIFLGICFWYLKEYKINSKALNEA